MLSLTFDNYNHSGRSDSCNHPYCLMLVIFLSPLIGQKNTHFLFQSSAHQSPVVYYTHYKFCITCPFFASTDSTTKLKSLICSNPLLFTKTFYMSISAGFALKSNPIKKHGKPITTKVMRHQVVLYCFFTPCTSGFYVIFQEDSHSTQDR